MRFEVDSAALSEAEEAIRWYAAKDPALGADFSLALEEVFQTIRSSPNRYGVLPEANARVPVRAGMTRRFPYLVVYFATVQRVRIVAVMHGSRKPNYWTGRV